MNLEVLDKVLLTAKDIEKFFGFSEYEARKIFRKIKQVDNDPLEIRKFKIPTKLFLKEIGTDINFLIKQQQLSETIKKAPAGTER